MAWGGGTITGGAPMGGAVGGSPGNPGNGLPFAGIPWEMRQGVEKLLADEPDQTDDPRWQATEGTFTHRMKETGVSLRRMLSPHRKMMTLSFFFILVEALCVQAGPFLSQKGIDDGIHPHDWTALTIIGILAILAVVVSAVASGARVATTGRVASRVMFELRVRTFAHLQRLSLDYYTDEKAGVIMTRMTSDIESLQQLLQDGLPQFALQG
ncbi:MAG TPA: ABC transporter transmembrane domain-containing protein, partial [Acidimicrobiia bacterium]